MIPVKIGARWIHFAECPEIPVVMRWIFGVGRVVLRNRLHRPFDGMAAGVFYHGMKLDKRGVGAETHGTRKLQSGLWIRRTAHGNLAALALRGDLKIEFSVVQQVRIAGPMLLVLVSFRKDPQLVSAIVKPFAARWRKRLPGKALVYEQKWMTIE